MSEGAQPMTHREVQPADFATADYRSVLRRLTTLDEEAADLRAEAARWHDGPPKSIERKIGQPNTRASCRPVLPRSHPGCVSVARF